MLQEIRIDSHRLDARVRRDARGFAVVPARVTRTGVFTYTRADGSAVRELRHPDDVFHPEHLRSIETAPVCVDHPGIDVTPHNVRQLEVGVVASSARRDGRFVAAELSIRDASAISKVERRELVELSLGYRVGRIDQRSGVYEGERYDQIQRDLRVNHVALLAPGGGRAGRDVCLRFDSASGVLISAAYTFHADADHPELEALRSDSQSRLDQLEHAARMQHLSPAQRELEELRDRSFDERIEAVERRLKSMGVNDER